MTAGKTIIKRHTIIAGEWNHRPLVGQFLEHWYDYYWLQSWEKMYRIRIQDTEYCVVSNDPRLSLADCQGLAANAFNGNLRTLELNDIPAVSVSENAEK